jgi:hypothetical protein
MKRALLILIFGFLGFASTTQSSGQVTISGTLKSITEKTYVIERNDQLYTIDRKYIPAAQAAKITRPEVPVTFVVPFEAVESSQEKPKTR